MTTRRTRLATIAVATLVVALTGCQQSGSTSSDPPASSQSSQPTASQTEQSSATPPNSPSPSSTDACDPYADYTTGAKEDATITDATVAGVRVQSEECVDRIIVNLLSPEGAGYMVGYVDQVERPGSGDPVKVSGGAVLRIIVLAAGDAGSGTPAWQPKNKNRVADVSDFQTFRQVAYAGAFEGETTIALGVREKLPFDVAVMGGEDPTTSRLVIAVRHE